MPKLTNESTQRDLTKIERIRLFFKFKNSWEKRQMDKTEIGMSIGSNVLFEMLSPLIKESADTPLINETCVPLHTIKAT